MPIYLLTSLEPVDYDENRAHVVRAKTPAAARRLAEDTAVGGGAWSTERGRWTDRERSRCEPIRSGADKHILSDFQAG